MGSDIGMYNHHPSGNPDLPNVDFIDISSYKDTLLYRGFPGLVADRLCELWADSAVDDCQKLEVAAAKTVGLMTQLRGAYGQIFENW